MIELSLFGVLLGTLASALSVVLAIVALTSVTYIAMTLITALRARPGPPLAPGALRGARLIGLSVAIAAAGFALLGLRVGSAGSGGEIVPTLSLAIAGAAALGSTTACALLGCARGVMMLQGARAARAARIEAAAAAETKLLEAKTERHREGDDLLEQAEAAAAGLARLRAALEKLARARSEIERKLDDDRATLGSELRTSYKRAHDEVTMKLEIGERILDAAEAATFRLACNAPLRKLVRRRPREALLCLEGLVSDQAGAPVTDASLAEATAALSSFLDDIRKARGSLQALLHKRPAGIKPSSDEDPWTLAQQDLAALDAAYQAVLSRVEVVRVRRAAAQSLEEVADAAGAVSASAKGLPADQGELSDLATEVTRAETAVAMATPVESDPGAITLALSRCTAALDRSDGASLDELLKALRSIV
jgi:hypothetical protein